MYFGQKSTAIDTTSAACGTTTASEGTATQGTAPSALDSTASSALSSVTGATASGGQSSAPTSSPQPSPPTGPSLGLPLGLGLGLGTPCLAALLIGCFLVGRRHGAASTATTAQGRSHAGKDHLNLTPSYLSLGRWVPLFARPDTVRKMSKTEMEAENSRTGAEGMVDGRPGELDARETARELDANDVKELDGVEIGKGKGFQVRVSTQEME